MRSREGHIRERLDLVYPVPETRNWMQMAFRVFLEFAPAPLGTRDLIDKLDWPDVTATVAVRALKKRGCIDFVPGSKRLYEVIPGAAFPEDLRGRAPGSRKGGRRPWIAKMNGNVSG